MSDGNIKTYTDSELQALRARGESQTDVAAVGAKTEAELEADIAADPDFRDVPADWYRTATVERITPKRLLSLRLDADVIEWFKRQGPGYQTRMNAVLRAFIDRSGRAG